MIFLLTSLALHILTIFGISDNEYMITSGLYDSLFYLQQLLLCIGLYKFVPVKLYRVKVITLLYIFSLVHAFLGYMLIFSFEDSDNIQSIQYLIDGTIVTALIILLMMACMRGHNYCDAYKKRGTFIVYKRATTLQGFVSSFVTYPYGSAFLVVNGKEFKFKRGVLVEKPHVNKAFYSYRRIEDMAIEEARDSLVGVKWSLFNNCFSVFEKFGDKDRAKSINTGNGA